MPGIEPSSAHITGITTELNSQSLTLIVKQCTPGIGRHRKSFNSSYKKRKKENRINGRHTMFMSKKKKNYRPIDLT